MDDRYARILTLFERKESKEAHTDSFEIIQRLQAAVDDLVAEIFYPYEFVRGQPGGKKGPDGVIKMGQRLVLYELKSGILDEYTARNISWLLNYAQTELLNITFPGTVYSVFIVCNDYSPKAVEALRNAADELRRPPKGVVIVTPQVLVKLHEVARTHVGIKDVALARLLQHFGPISIQQVNDSFEKSAETAHGFLETAAGPLRVTVEYREQKAEFEGNFDEVWRSINKFMSQIRPSHVEQAIANLLYNEDLELLVQGLSGLLRISPEGPFVLIPHKDLKATDLISLVLLGNHVGYRIGVVNDESLSVDEIVTFTRLLKSVVQVRLSEMSRDRLIEISAEGKRKLTTIGIWQLQNEMLPRLRENFPGPSSSTQKTPP